MNEGAANLVDHVLPEHVPIRQWVLTLPYPLRYPLAFDPNHLGPVLRLFTDTVSAWYGRQRISSSSSLGPDGETPFRTRILRYLEKRGLITFTAASGDDEVNAVLGEGFGESNPARSTLLHAATSGSPPAGPAHKRAPVRMLREAGTGPEPKGYLCAQLGAFNLHAARRVAPNDRQGREMLCRYILRPRWPRANWRMNGCTCWRTGA